MQNVTLHYIFSALAAMFPNYKRHYKINEMRKWRIKNAEHVKAYAKARWLKRTEEARSKSLQYYYDNHEHCKARALKYYYDVVRPKNGLPFAEMPLVPKKYREQVPPAVPEISIGISIGSDNWYESVKAGILKGISTKTLPQAEQTIWWTMFNARIAVNSE